MKLKTILSDNLFSQPYNYLSTNPSIVNNNIIKENDSHIGSLIDSTMSKLKSALTASSVDDLAVLLDIMSPGAVKSQDLQKLITYSSGSKDSIISNNDWWNALFDTTNITDINIRNQIIDKVKADLGIKESFNYTTVTEAGFMDRIKDLGSSIVNPKLGSEINKRSSLKYNNQRIAKLALQYVKQHIRTQFDDMLASNGYDPNNIINLYKSYTNLKSKLDRNNNNPKLREQYKNVVNQLTSIIELFNTSGTSGTSGTTEQPTPPESSENSPEKPQQSQASGQTKGTDSTNTSQQKASEDGFTQEQKAAGRDLIMRMGQIGMKAGRTAAAKKMSDVDIYNAIKYAGKKLAQQYHKTDPKVAISAYKYFSDTLKKQYREVVMKANTFEDFMKNFTNIIIG